MDYIRRCAQGLARQFGTNDPFALSAALDIVILEVELPANIRGFFTHCLDTSIIYLNQSLRDPVQRRVVCAHELGHALLHKGCNSLFLEHRTSLVTGRYEWEAELFSGWLLLEEGALRECAQDGWTLEQTASATGLPTRVVEACTQSLREEGSLK